MVKIAGGVLYPIVSREVWHAGIFIDREAREIIYLVASAHPSFRLSFCLSVCALLFVCDQWAYADNFAAINHLTILSFFLIFLYISKVRHGF